MIIEEDLYVRIGSKNINHFKKLGYLCNVSEVIRVKSTELMNGSRTKIKAQCDVCAKIKEIGYSTYLKNIKKYPIYCCGTSCAKIKENETKLKKYGKNYEESRVKKMKETNILRYGNEKTSQIFRNEKDIKVFIEELKNIYGDKYDYSMINYINNYTSVEIGCKKHGHFKIRPIELLKGQGCKYCNRDSIKDKILNEHLEKSIKIHGNKYNYSKIEYKDDSTKVLIVCPEHGDFYQRLSDHSVGKGCAKCSFNYSDKDWINMFKNIHGDKYDYSETEYLNAKTKIKVKCSYHKEYFYLLPGPHLKGVGCPLCANIGRRKYRINKISKDKYNGFRPTPSFNEKACQLFDEISKEKNINIRHAMNGGEFYIKELGYWLDGYDRENNVVYEYDEKYHFYKGELRKKDINRQKEIIEILKCDFIRIKE